MEQKPEGGSTKTRRGGKKLQTKTTRGGNNRKGRCGSLEPSWIFKHRRSELNLRAQVFLWAHPWRCHPSSVRRCQLKAHKWAHLWVAGVVFPPATAAFLQQQHLSAEARGLQERRQMFCLHVCLHICCPQKQKGFLSLLCCSCAFFIWRRLRCERGLISRAADVWNAAFFALLSSLEWRTRCQRVMPSRFYQCLKQVVRCRFPEQRQIPNADLPDGRAVWTRRYGNLFFHFGFLILSSTSAKLRLRDSPASLGIRPDPSTHVVSPLGHAFVCGSFFLFLQPSSTPVS